MLIILMAKNDTGCCQLMFLNEIEEKFRQLKQKNEKFKTQNKKGIRAKEKIRILIESDGTREKKLGY